MNNILSFPMNAWDLKKVKTDSQTSFDTELLSDDSTEQKVNLLTTLSFLRDCLGNEPQSLDAKTLQSCLSATRVAFDTAMSMERTILRQSLHIEDMARIACTDQLTGVYNRRGFEQESQRVLSAATRYGETGVLIYVDLDGFKPINDTYGHAAGDEMLIEVARLLNEHVRPHDMVARLGGDEFAVLLTRTSWEDGLNRAERIKQILNTHYVNWNGKHIAMRASLGFQCYGANADADTLLHAADSAMYQAKRLRNETP